MAQKTLPQNITFVDVETSGMKPSRDRVIEIGIIRVEDGKVVKEFNSLIDPESHVPGWITNVTGIKNSDVVGQPVFGDVAQEVMELFKDSLFVAHNVAFDYGFIGQEFKRLGLDFCQSKLCTIKLSRKVYPQYPRHSLSHIIYRHKIKIENRHRAYDDALVLFEFYNQIINEHPLQQISPLINQLISHPNQSHDRSQLSFG